MKPEERLAGAAIRRKEPARLHTLVLATALCTVVLGCAAHGGLAPFDSEAHLRQRFAERLGPEEAARIQIPYALDPELESLVEERISPAGREQWRVDQVLDFIFHRLGLQYSRMPTRSAVDTYRTRQGNCLSFVNLFVGVARQVRLNPFYVEVQDYQRWIYHDGTVISSGHIVAGMRVDGELRTFDFLPYRPKSYRDFEPIDELQATAHYYNNLGAEALLAGNLERAYDLFRIAATLAPGFDKASNNLGVALMRMSRHQEAVAVLETALESDPKDVALLSNLARAYQQLGRDRQAMALLATIESMHQIHPYFFIYRGELALARGDTDKALEFMVKALRRDSEIPEVHVGLAKVYLAVGDVERARHHVARALRLDATHPEARRYAAMIDDMQVR